MNNQCVIVTESNIQELARLVREFEGEVDQAIEIYLDSPEHFAVLAIKQDDTVVGYARCDVVDAPPDVQGLTRNGNKLIHVTHIEVAESERGQGWGGKLLDCIEYETWQRGYQGFWITCRVDNAPARALYKKRSYMETPAQAEDASELYVYKELDA